MSTIDSGLGWSCDSDYYVDTTGILGTYGGHTVSKTNAGAAFCANYKYNDGVNPMTYGAAIFSTVADYVAATGNMGTESGQYTIDGVTWYKTNIYNVPAATSTMLTDYPLVETTITPQMTAEQQYRLFLQAANVQPTAKKIPTTDYVKAFVEGVEAETAERVNAVNNILTDDTAYSSSAMVTIPDCKVPSNVAVNVEFEPVQEGTGDSSPENIRPISGYSDISITRTGKNLFDIGVLTYPFDDKGVTVSMSDGVLTMNGTTTDTLVYPPSPDGGYTYPNQLMFKNLKPSTSYVFTTGYSNVMLNAFYRETEYGTGTNIAETNGTGIMAFTTPSNYAVIWIRITIQSETTLNNVKIYPMIRLASDPDSAFAPYTGKDYILSLNGTRYGGRVDISDTGETVLTVDRKLLELDTQSADNITVLGDYTRYLFNYKATDVNTNLAYTAISNVAKWQDNWDAENTHFYISVNQPNVGNVIFTIPTSSISSISSFQVCYPIASSFQIPLPNTSIELEKGTNNLYSDAGNISATANSVTSAIGALTEQVNDITLYPAPPTTDGTYSLQVNVTSGVPAYTWADVNRSAPAVNEPNEGLKKSEDSGNISEEKEIAEERE